MAARVLELEINIRFPDYTFKATSFIRSGLSLYMLKKFYFKRHMALEEIPSS